MLDLLALGAFLVFYGFCLGLGFHLIGKVLDRIGSLLQSRRIKKLAKELAEKGRSP